MLDKQDIERRHQSKIDYTETLAMLDTQDIGRGVFVLCLVCPALPVFLYNLFLIGVFVLCLVCPALPVFLYNLFLIGVFVLCLMCPALPVFLHNLFLIGFIYFQMFILIIMSV
jgi:hypothetical protein